jgi:carboxypeptidase Q
MRIARLVIVSVVIATGTAEAQDVRSRYGSAADRIISAALSDSAAYHRVGELVDRFGHRFSGSQNLENAIDWVLAEMRRDGLENVRGEPVTVPHWVRGAESAELVSPRRMPLHMLGLGGSIATPPRGITAPVLSSRASTS